MDPEYTSFNLTPELENSLSWYQDQLVPESETS